MVLVEADVESSFHGCPYDIFLEQFVAVDGQLVAVPLFGMDERGCQHVLVGIGGDMEAVAVVFYDGLVLHVKHHAFLSAPGFGQWWVVRSWSWIFLVIVF